MLVLYSFFILLIVTNFRFGLLIFNVSPCFCFALSRDTFSFQFTLVLGAISCSVLLWSYYYIGTEAAFARFFGLVLCFLGSMFLLIYGTNLVSLCLAWDLLGFTSFFLVSYLGNRRAWGAAILTSLSNRIGDVFFFAIIGIMIFSGSPSSFLGLAVICLVAFTKSAQSPFSSWLPAAMYAPTPVSALVHSSTLVTAGVYLLFRFSNFEATILVAVGVLTTLLGGLCASLEPDSKKIIALSTLSQLGIIITGLGLSLRTLTFNHILSHAIIKATLFLTIGVSIHGYYGSQESRSYFGLSAARPLTYTVLVVSALGLGGLSFTSGYYTKDLLLESAIRNTWCLVELIFFYFGIGLTLSYLLCLVRCLHGAKNGGLGCISLFSVGLSCKFPFFILLRTALLQALYFSGCSPLGMNVLSLCDKSLIYTSMVLGAVFGYFISRGSVSLPRPLAYLFATRRSLAFLLLPIGSMSRLESSLVLGLGLSKGGAIARTLQWPLLKISKPVCFIVLIMCLV